MPKYNSTDTRGQFKLRFEQQLLPNTPPLPIGAFSLIYADFPVRYNLRESDETHRGRTPYPTMSDEEILKFPLGTLAAESAYLLCWATKDHLHLMFHCFETWGFKYVNLIPWLKTTIQGDKPRIGIGHYGRNCFEPLLVGIKGNPGSFTSLGLTNIPGVFLEQEEAAIFAPRTDHSTKPESSYLLAERLHQAMLAKGILGEKIELFARRQRPDWTCWGAEV